MTADETAFQSLLSLNHLNEICSLYFKFSSALCNIPFALMGYDTQSKCALSSYNKSFANAECSEKDKDIKSNQFTRRDS